MSKSSTDPAAEVNRSFSKLLRRAIAGETIIITDRGRATAVLQPVGPGHYNDVSDDERRERELAFEELMTRLRSQKPMYLGRFSRDWAYDDD